MTKPEPFLLQPAGKDYLWGGNRLHTLFGKQIPLHPLAETWECSTHPDGCSIVASGVDKGKTLTEVLQQHPEFLGAKTSRSFFDLWLFQTHAARTAGHLFKREYDFVLSSENPCEKGRCLPDTCRNGARHWCRYCIGRNSAELQPHLSAL